MYCTVCVLAVFREGLVASMQGAAWSVQPQQMWQVLQRGRVLALKPCCDVSLCLLMTAQCRALGVWFMLLYKRVFSLFCSCVRALRCQQARLCLHTGIAFWALLEVVSALLSTWQVRPFISCLAVAVSRVDVAF
jgi:hypothetical protein